ncbi:pilin [Microvirgula aerodenitrificans]|uniref:pilin n=1 Tax=Microvirgula aerodenitrificans TaxID=57480 RepID=UPI002F429D0E
MTAPRPQGFSLIERMLLVAVVGISSAIALPLYWQHANRSQVTLALEALATTRASVSAYYATHGRMPAATEQAVISPSALVARIADAPAGAGSRRYLVTLSASDALASTLRHTTFELIGTGDSTTRRVQWRCQPGSTSPTPARYLPESCG